MTAFVRFDVDFKSNMIHVIKFVLNIYLGDTYSKPTEIKYETEKQNDFD